jgi:hypothetical protein
MFKVPIYGFAKRVDPHDTVGRALDIWKRHEGRAAEAPKAMPQPPKARR